MKPYSYHWPFTRAYAGTLDLYGLGAVPLADAQDRLLVGLPHYWDGGAGAYYSYVGSGDKFYDDNAWTGFNLLRANRLTGDSGVLERAKAVFKFIDAGWDSARNHPAPGGVFWVQATWNRDRNTVSNAPSAELGLRLYQSTTRTITDQKTYLTPATNMLQLGRPLPALGRQQRHDGRALLGPHQPQRRYREDPVELQPGHDDRSRRAALPDL